MIASLAEGRVRFRHAAFKRTGITEKISKVFETRAGIEDIEINRRVGSLLVFFDRAVIELKEIETILHGYVQDWGRPLDAPSLSRVSPGRDRRHGALSRRRSINLGMVISLAGSLLALLVRARGVHVQLGILFMVLSIAHLVDKRKTLLL